MSIFKKLLGEKANESVSTQKRALYVQTRQTPSGIYEDYKAGDAATAREFLVTKKVERPKYYIKVVTPEGNWGMDIEGLYLEHLLPFQLDIASAQYDGVICGIPETFGIKAVINGISDNFIVEVGCGHCNHRWLDGIRYQSFTVVRCPQCRALNKIDSGNIKVLGMTNLLNAD